MARSMREHFIIAGKRNARNLESIEYDFDIFQIFLQKSKPKELTYRERQFLVDDGLSRA